MLKVKKQAGAELCQAHTQVSFPAEAELNLAGEFQIWAFTREAIIIFLNHI